MLINKRHRIYRAWDKDNNRMIYPADRRNDTSIVFDAAGWFIIDHFSGRPKNILTQFEGELMDFTGRFDKNGNKIFEGDIVRRMADRFDYNKPEEEEHWKEEEISYIEFRNNGFWVKDEDMGYEGENLWDWEQMVVIGNIYENPDILTKSSTT